MALTLTEEELQEETLRDLDVAGWTTLRGRDIVPGTGRRRSWSDLVLYKDLHTALVNLNPEVPDQYLLQAIDEILTPQSQDPVEENYRLHGVLTRGYSGITYVDEDGELTTPTITFISADTTRNRYLAVDEVAITDGHNHRRFDIVLYVNGLPLVVIELKRAGVEDVDAEAAFNQLQTYVEEFPLAFAPVALAVASDGVTARYATPFTPWNHFARWNVDEHGAPADESIHPDLGTGLEMLISGALNPQTLEELRRDFIAFGKTKEGLSKKVAKPHQFFAVKEAVRSTVNAVGSDGRAGVVWHTQGSGKSMEMELYAAKVMRHPRLANPTIVVITDRNELDTQLYDSFQASTLLPESPQRITTRAELREQLAARRTGGIYFTTLQKFGLTREERESGSDHPLLSDRRNIIVIVDEAHRSHYDNIDGYAAHLKSALPHASMIAFTGTPIAEGERDTRRVFGDDIHTYDLLRAVEDGATVPVAFEPRLIALKRTSEMTDEDIDDAAEEATESLDDPDRDRLERNVAVLNTVYGAPERLKELADDLVKHWERRSDAMRPFIGGPGKAMVVCSTRENAARLYEEIVALRPDWHSDDDLSGKIKVVYTASPADKAEIKKHMRRPSANAKVKNRLKSDEDELEIVLVKDMMLTGFDAPPLHTLYLDRPLKGALLMQTLARVNRTFRGKPNGLLVAYAPVEANLASALVEWTSHGSGRQGSQTTSAEAAAVVLDALNKLEALVGTRWKQSWKANPKADKFAAVKTLTNYLRDPATPGNSVPGEPERRPVAERFKKVATGLARNYAIAAGESEVELRRHEVQTYEETRVWLAKLTAQERVSKGLPVPEEVKRMLGYIIVTSTESRGVIDIYEQAGLARPDLASLTPKWLEEANEPGKAQLAIEALKAVLLAEMSQAARNNEVRRQQFSERINDLMERYTTGQLDSAQALAGLADMAGEVQEETQRGTQFDPPLDPSELAFYDLISKEEALAGQPEPVRAQIARDLYAAMVESEQTDWTQRDMIRARMRRGIKRILRRHRLGADTESISVKVFDLMEQMAPRREAVR